MTRSLSMIGSDLAATLRAIAAGPHSAHRRAAEAAVRMVRECPHCHGTGENAVGTGRVCWRCDGTGEIVIDEPEEDARPVDPHADDWWFENESDRAAEAVFLFRPVLSS